MPTAMLASRAGPIFSTRPRNDSLMLADALDRILQRGVSVQGNVSIGLADVELLFLDLRLLLGSVDTIWPEGRPQLPPIRPVEPGQAPERSSAAPSRTLPKTSPSKTSPSKPSPAAPPATGLRDAGHAAVEAALLPTPPESAAAPGPSSTAQGLVRLVLTLVKLLHDVLQRQAVRRMETGRLTDAQIEDIGTALSRQADEIERLKRLFGFSDADLSLDLGVPDGAP